MLINITIFKENLHISKHFNSFLFYSKFTVAKCRNIMVKLFQVRLIACMHVHVIAITYTYSRDLHRVLGTAYLDFLFTSPRVQDTVQV